MGILQHVVVSGLVIGILATVLTQLGNPANMGICVACFIRDVAGGLGFHRAAVVQNIRPEFIGFVLGSFFIAKQKKEFQAQGGASPLIRFALGCIMMIGALVFLGCPLRMVLRLAAGDLNALVALFGFTTGIFLGTFFLRRGFTLGRATAQGTINGYLFPLFSLVLLLLRVFSPRGVFLSETGPGSQFAPILLALLAGGVVGILGQRSRMCLSGGIRDGILIKDSHLLQGFLGILGASFLMNLLFSNFTLGFSSQPVAHTQGLWNFLGMLLVGLCAVLLGGCPLRQTILAGQGNTDSAFSVLGMLAGGAIAHNFFLAASPAGVGTPGRVLVLLGILLVSLLGFFSQQDKKPWIPGTTPHHKTVS